MAFDIYVIIFLFLVGLFAGMIYVIIGLKLPIKSKKINICDHCNITYKWYELIPIVSYIINNRHCPYCQKKLNIYYPIIEIITGVCFSLSYIYYGFSYELIAMLTIISLTMIIYVSDFKYYIISDIPLYTSIAIILIFKYIFFGFKTLLISFVSGATIFLFMLLIRFIGNKLFKTESLGGGDIKLSFFFGAVFGIRLSIIALIIGSFLAFPYAIYSAISDNTKEIPFGPFLISALLIVFIYMEPIKELLNILYVGF